VARISDILGELSQTLGVPVLTPEYEIALALVDYPCLTAEQLIERSSLSRAGFFNTAERLRTWGIIVSSTDPADRRRKMYRLRSTIYNLIISHFWEYRSSYDLLLRESTRNPHLICKEFLMRPEVGLNYFSCEFQIIYYIFFARNISNNDLLSLVNCSETKLVTSLRELSARGIVHFTVDEGDRRRRLYDLGDHIRSLLEELHRNVFAWLENVPAIQPRPSESQKPKNCSQISG
jgi:DNA-binding MarR family transcriptional regulator